MGNPVLMATKRERPYQSAMRQRQAEETKHRIVAASRKLLKSKGYSGMTIEAIAKKAAWKTKPTWYLVSKDDAIIPPENERMFAKRMNATTKEIAGSHVAFVAHPEDAAKLIEDAALTASAK